VIDDTVKDHRTSAVVEYFLSAHEKSVSGIIYISVINHISFKWQPRAYIVYGNCVGTAGGVSAGLSRGFIAS
jgi:hypothetical protein